MSNNKQSSVSQLISEIKRRVAIIQSEPQTMARELMIDNLSIDLEQYEAMHKEEMINFHIEVMKSGLIKEGEVIWTDAYLPKISSIANQKYNKKFGGNNEQQ